MIESLLEPFYYDYMIRAILISALVGGVCAFLSCFLMLKGWSLMGDALAHAIVPGVALAYILALPYAIGAFFAGFLAALSMVFVRAITRLREDAVIGLIFTTFFALGLLIVSIQPTAVDLRGIILGNILAITDADIVQVVLICAVCVSVLLIKWKDFLTVFFDENHAASVGLQVLPLKILFFTLLSAACVAALQTVGACLVIAMVITPGALAYLLTDRFSRLILISCASGILTSGFGAYLSFFVNANPGGLIVTIQTLLFLTAFFVAPKYGFLRRRRRLKPLEAGNE